MKISKNTRFFSIQTKLRTYAESIQRKQMAKYSDRLNEMFTVAVHSDHYERTTTNKYEIRSFSNSTYYCNFCIHLR